MLPLSKVSSGTAVIVFFQFLGGAVFLAVAQAVFESKLIEQLVALLHDTDPGAVVRAGAAAVRQTVAPDQIPAVLQAYNVAITTAFVRCKPWSTFVLLMV